MKLYAFARGADEDRLVHVWDAQRLKDAGKTVRFFSTELDAAARREMVLVHRGDLMFFRYLQSPEGGEGGGQTLTHLKVKEFLCRESHIRLMLPEGMVELWTRAAQSEYRIMTEADNPVICDVYAQLQAGNPPERVKRWRDEVLFEVTVTHPTPSEKVGSLARAGYTVIEIPVERHLWIPEDVESDEATILRAEDRLREHLLRGIAARILTEPGRPQRRGSALYAKIRSFMEKMITN